MNDEYMNMVCPKCKKQYDIYNAVVNDDSGKWVCPNDGAELIDRDVKLGGKIK